MDTYQEFIAKGHYCRWLEEEGRRETWAEVCARFADYWYGKGVIDLRENNIFTEAVYKTEVMPSMRVLMTAGPALDRDNVAGYNCSYSSIDGKGKVIELDHDELDETVKVHLSDVVVFDEIIYVLLCGTGVGFSVERQYINTLPVVGEDLNRRRYKPFKSNYPGVDKESLSTFNECTNTIHVADTKYGWASALRILITECYNGNHQDIEWDLTALRPAGARLKTFGGRSSGPAPLARLLTFVKETMSKAHGRKLTSIECHDICCMIGDVVVVGGVRRSALISLSNLTDDRMRRAKMGDWREHSPHRQLSNNSICYTEKPDFAAFLTEQKAMYESYSGERGIFNRRSAVSQAGRSGRRVVSNDYGTNPCSEIILRPQQFCNLSEVVVRRDDSLADLRRKVRIATAFGSLQATLTDFKYLRPVWRENCEEEALLGVSLTGIMDHCIMSGQESHTLLASWLEELKQVAVDTNKEWAERLGIAQSAAITCVKPSGTVSQLVNSSSGIHPRYADYYIRRVRADEHDPLVPFMIDQKVPYEVSGSTYVFEFPQKAPEGAVTAQDFLGVQQLELWKLYQDHWCEHKPSITVYYRDEDFFEIGQWVYNHFDEISGVAFLPYDDHVYELAPYEPISEENYLALKGKMPGTIDWDKLSEYESTDNTTGSQELACSGSTCEVVDLK